MACYDVLHEDVDHHYSPGRRTRTRARSGVRSHRAHTGAKVGLQVAVVLARDGYENRITRPPDVQFKRIRLPFGKLCQPAVEPRLPLGHRPGIAGGSGVTRFEGDNTGTPGEVLYTTSGTTDDYAYGTLGVAASTIEFGSSSGSCGGFTPPYSCQDGFYNTNRQLLIYAGKLAREPYTLALGPNTHTASVTPASVVAGTTVTVAARGQDSAYGSTGVARPASQTVNAAQYYLDVPPWAGGTPVAMTATDGNFNSASELIRALNVSTTGLTPGVHTIYVRSRDASNNWGPVTAVKLTIQ